MARKVALGTISILLLSFSGVLFSANFRPTFRSERRLRTPAGQIMRRCFVLTSDTGSYSLQVLGAKLSSSRAPSLAPSPLRTGLEGFPFIRLEHSKTPP